MQFYSFKKIFNLVHFLSPKIKLSIDNLLWTCTTLYLKVPKTYSIYGCFHCVSPKSQILYSNSTFWSNFVLEICPDPAHEVFVLSFLDRIFKHFQKTFTLFLGKQIHINSYYSEILEYFVQQNYFSSNCSSINDKWFRQKSLFLFKTLTFVDNLTLKFGFFLLATF